MANRIPLAAWAHRHGLSVQQAMKEITTGRLDAVRGEGRLGGWTVSADARPASERPFVDLAEVERMRADLAALRECMQITAGALHAFDRGEDMGPRWAAKCAVVLDLYSRDTFPAAKAAATARRLEKGASLRELFDEAIGGRP